MRLPTLALFALTTVAGAQTPRAYSYDFTLDTHGKDSDKPVHGTVRVAGNRARVDTDEHKKDGEYLLLSEGGRRVFVVHPKDQSFQEYDADEFARIVGTALRAVGPVVKFDVRDATIDTARLGSGGTVAGRSTNRVRVDQHWKTTIKVFGFGKEMRGSAASEYWSDPSLPLMRNPILDLTSVATLALGASDEDFLARSDAARERLFRGAPLRAELHTRIAGDEGPDDTRLRYEVTRYTPGPVDESALQLPKGYRRSSSREVSF